jgi:hypothetical protein
LQYPKLFTVSWTVRFPLPVPADISLIIDASVLSNERINFSFVLLGTGSLWEITTGLIGNVRVVVFKMLYPLSDSAAYTYQYRAWLSAVGISF